MMDDCKEEAREHLDKEDKSEQCSYFKEGLHNEVSLLEETQKTNIDQNVIENQWRNQVGARGALRPPWMHFGLILGKFVDENVLI